MVRNKRFVLLITLFWSFLGTLSESYAQRSLKEYKKYLKTNGDEEAQMVVGTGTYYGAHGDAIYKVDREATVLPDKVLDITKKKDTKKIPDNFFHSIELEHLPTAIFHQGAESLFKEILRMLKSGGVLIMNDMAEWTTGPASGPFMCQLSVWQYRDLLDGGGKKKAEDLVQETTALFFFKWGYSFAKFFEGKWYIYKASK